MLRHPVRKRVRVAEGAGDTISALPRAVCAYLA